MSKITLNDVTNIGSLSVINSNFDKIEQELQNKVLYRNNPTGEPNTVERDIDMNGNSLLNVGKVYSVNGRWATIDEVEDIKDEVVANAVIVEANKDIAVASATAAATSYDNFDDRYLGQKTADPSVDNDGGLLLTGALYFRTSGTPIMRVYNGTTWQDVGSITTTTTNLIDPPLYSSQAEAEAGANNTKVMTPLRVKNAVDSQIKAGYTSTGPILLPNNAVNALEAVPKQQLDAQTTGRLIAIRKFTAAESGTSYTKSTGTRAIYIKQCAGGGGGGGSYATGGSQYSIGCSAGAGSYAEGWFASGFDGAVLTIGSGGVAGTAAGNGGDGGATSFGSLLSCPGGVGGIANGVVGSGGNWHQFGGAGGSIPTGTALLALPGDAAEPVWTAGSLGFRGRSGASPLGTSIASNPSTGNGIGATVAANGYGVGGMGAFSGPSDVARVGGKGSDGVIFVYEFA